jgi:hypothetical protein
MSLFLCLVRATPHKQTMEATISPGEQLQDLTMEATIIRRSWFSIATTSAVSPGGDGCDPRRQRKKSTSVRILGGIMKKGPTDSDDVSVLNIVMIFFASLLKRLRFLGAAMFYFRK